jgi:lysophospholipase L1-like esterase
MKILLLNIFALLALSTTGKKKITIWMCGDSTMSIKETKAYPETGWGMPFVYFWDSTVTVVNKAKNGRSTQSFINEGLWKSVIDNAVEGDYVFIQFSHNDEVPTKKTYTTPDQFRGNLVRYITETRAKKAIPVLFTSVSRRKFDSTGHALETHAEYSAIAREVAANQRVTLIDMDKRTMALYEQVGVEHSKLLFLQLKPGQHPNYPEGKEDNTHFSELGARLVAEIALEEIRKQLPELAERVVKR